MVVLIAAAVLHALANAGPVAPPPLPWDASEIPWLVGAGVVRSIPFFGVLAALAWLGRRASRSTADSGSEGLT